ncbi:hypothetical protein CHS0354_029765 [Potamilus streckersoni]|uniref:Peptidase M14 domain-containing protein n=1 Tax=Potamilus streckersoni TaxID=2493646 RepID=A0AAE0TH61_9BIVA|nr:hypothetical protein CHS0354_029765 [Potamilus streckersoni]
MRIAVFILVIESVYVSSATPSQQKSFHGHKVLDILPRTESELKSILNLIEEYELDVWYEPKNLNDSLHVHVEPEKLGQVLSHLKKLGSEVKVWIENVQKLIDGSFTPEDNLQRRVIMQRSLNLNKTYYNYSEIMTYLDYVQENARGVHVSQQVIGQSVKGRDLRVLKVSRSSNSAKKAIIIDGGIHAREWISLASVIWMMDKLVFNPRNDPDVKKLLKKFDFYLIPVLNPDGYEFSRTNDRLWRKNRRINSGSNCVGVDLNRNFDYKWNPNRGGSRNPCSTVYSGTRALSEPESAALASFINSLMGVDNGGRVQAYLNIHSYGQYWLYPWGFTTAYPVDRLDLDNLAQVAVTAIQKVNGKRFTVGSSRNVLYLAAGGSDDYAKGSAGVKYSYTLELRDTGAYGFVLPEKQILPACEETWAGVKAFALALAKS